jgi:hypothetical protein
MSYQNSQPTRAIRVVLNDNVNIPYPNPVWGGTTTAQSAFLLIDTDSDFILRGMKVGDTVYNVSTEAMAIVTSVSQTELGVSLDVFGSGEAYTIYQGANTGCSLYVGSGGTLSVLTAGNDTVLLENVATGTFIPVKVLRVNVTDTSASSIIALW